MGEMVYENPLALYRPGIFIADTDSRATFTGFLNEFRVTIENISLWIGLQR